MDGFEHCAFLADVSARHQTQTSNQSRAKIRDDVAIEILAQQDVELFGPHHQLHRGVVDDHVYSFDLRMIFCDFVKTSQEQSVGQFHDVRFVYRGDLLAVFAQRIVERKVGNSRRSFLSNNLQTLNYAGDDFVFEA